MSDDLIGIMIILGILAIILFGGAQGNHINGLVSTTDRTPEQKYVDIQQGINTAQNQALDLQRQIQVEQDQKINSIYKGKIFLSYVSRSDDPAQEYVAIRDSSGSGESIPVTGWTLKSSATNATVTIPQGTYLFYTATVNTESNIYLNNGDTLYLVSGISPNGASFKTNKCSGYLSQFQTFVPYLNTYCPLPRYENLSSIPKTPANDQCLDYIDSMSSCRIQTDSLPANFGYECTNFIYNKVNYASCVDTHRSDSDFYGNEWRVYLKHVGSIWKKEREKITLYDSQGKIVDTISY